MRIDMMVSSGRDVNEIHHSGDPWVDPRSRLQSADSALAVTGFYFGWPRVPYFCH